MNRGFTLVELAIVIVIAGILAAVAVPIYQSLVNDSKWAEAEGAASTVRSAVNIAITKNSGYDALTMTGGNMADGNIPTGVELNEADFGDLKYFLPLDIASVDGTAPIGTTNNYHVQVAGGSESAGTAPAGAPDGDYYLTDQGDNDVVEATTTS